VSEDSPAEVLQPAPIFDKASTFVEDCGVQSVMRFCDEQPLYF